MFYARDAFEGMRRQRRHARSWRELRAIQRDFEQMLLELMIVLEIDLVLALLRLVQRRLRDVDVTAFDELGHLPVEKRQQQRADV